MVSSTQTTVCSVNSNSASESKSDSLSTTNSQSNAKAILGDLKQIPYNLIHIGQSETARLNINQTKNTGILITNLQNCLAVIFKDSKGNVSATHADIQTDLSFLTIEAQKMQGAYTIDVIKNSNANNNFFQKIFPNILKRVGNIKNSKGTYEVRQTKTGTIIIRDAKMLTPSVNDVLNFVVAARTQSEVDKNNPLKDYTLDKGREHVGMQIYKRFINLHIEPVENSLPQVVYDNGWTGNILQLSKPAQTVLTTARKISDKNEFEKYLLSFAHKTPGIEDPFNRALANNLPQYVRDYWELEKVIKLYGS